MDEGILLAPPSSIILLGAWHKYTWWLVAPALRFIEHDHGPLTVHDETQLRAYYRPMPDMQHPTPVFGSTPLGPRAAARVPADPHHPPAP